jgi:glycosyltransferase involved in cell wall biosynthesis
MGRILHDPELQTTLSNRGLERSKLFSWDKCARQTLAIIEGSN